MTELNKIPGVYQIRSEAQQSKTHKQYFYEIIKAGQGQVLIWPIATAVLKKTPTFAQQTRLMTWLLFSDLIRVG